MLKKNLVNACKPNCSNAVTLVNLLWFTEMCSAKSNISMVQILTFTEGNNCKSMMTPTNTADHYSMCKIRVSFTYHTSASHC